MTDIYQKERQIVRVKIKCKNSSIQDIHLFLFLV